MALTCVDFSGNFVFILTGCGICWSVFVACLRSLMLRTFPNSAPAPSPNDPVELRSGLMSGLLIGFLAINLSFSLLAGEPPRIELAMLFRRPAPSGDGALRVSARSIKPGEAGDGICSDAGSLDEALGKAAAAWILAAV